MVRRNILLAYSNQMLSFPFFLAAKKEPNKRWGL
jgi:hypothetical protein